MKEKDFDVIVFGAGAPGVAAAVAAAEDGARVLLADDVPCVGGEQVCGLMSHWQGSTEGFLMEHVRPVSRRAWGRPIFEPDDLRQVLESALAQAGVSVLLRARPIKAKVGNGRIKRVVFATAGEQRRLSAWCYVDATAAGTLGRLAGCGLSAGEDALALNARIGGIDTRVPGVFDPEALSQWSERLRSGVAAEEYPAGLMFPRLTPLPRGGTAVLEASWRGVPGLDATAAEALCRDYALAAIAFLRDAVPGYENCFLVNFAEQPLPVQPRQPLRRRPGQCILQGDGVEDIPVLTRRDAAQEQHAVPFGHFICRDMDNLLLARPADAAPDQLPLLLDAGYAVGRAAALAVAYDGHALKIEPGRVSRLLAGSRAPQEDAYAEE